MQLSFDQVSFSYPGAKDAAPALDNISFSLEEGSFWGIAGATGCGKTTLLRLLSGLEHPTQGRILADGADLSLKETQRACKGKIGLVFQYPEKQLFANSVLEDVSFGPKNLGWSDKQVQTSAHQALEDVGLDPDELGTLSPFSLSGGQQRRIAIAGVLAMQPEVLALDEPTAGLDARSHHDLMQLLQNLQQRGTTIVLVSHNMDDLAAACSHVMLLKKGRLAAKGAPRSALTKAPYLPFSQKMATELGLPGFYPTLESVADALAKA